LQFGSIYQHFSSFGNGYLFYLFVVVKSSAVPYRSNVNWCHLIWATVYIPTSVCCSSLYYEYS